MSATDRTATFEVGAVAHVSFRVRCEALGHGEEVFLVAEGDAGRKKVRVWNVTVLALYGGRSTRYLAWKKRRRRHNGSLLGGLLPCQLSGLFVLLLPDFSCNCRSNSS
jgi:hypothetical protein